MIVTLPLTTMLEESANLHGMAYSMRVQYRMLTMVPSAFLGIALQGVTILIKFQLEKSYSEF